MTIRRSCSIGAAVLAASFMSGACGTAHTAAETNEAALPQMPTGAVAMVRIAEPMAASIRLDTVALRNVPRVLRASGTVQLDESRVARVLAPVPGHVSGIAANIGDHVRRDEALFYLDSRDAASAIEDQLDSEKDLDLAEKTMTMTQDLYDHQAASRMTLDQAEADLAKAHARVDRASAALTTIGYHAPDDSAPAAPRIPVTTPIAGDVLERHLNDGQFVQPDPSPLFVIADLSTVWVAANVFEPDLHVLHLGETADTTTAAYPDQHFRAQVAQISDVVDPTTRTVNVRFVVANPDQRLKPEMFATVTLYLDTLEQAITLPASAILTEGDRSYIYVAVDDRTFARRPVDISVESDGSRRVLSGLAAGERVVTTGAILLRGEEDRASN